MTERAEIATRMGAAWLSTYGEQTAMTDRLASEVAKAAVTFADALLAELASPAAPAQSIVDLVARVKLDWVDGNNCYTAHSGIGSDWFVYLCDARDEESKPVWRAGKIGFSAAKDPGYGTPGEARDFCERHEFILLSEPNPKLVTRQEIADAVFGDGSVENAIDRLCDLMVQKGVMD